MDVDKINRLPKWAQDEIRRLKANAAATQRDIEVLCGQTLQGDSASKGFLGLCPAVADGPSYHAVDGKTLLARLEELAAKRR
jgi:hypothetical protein